jgi:polyisoprenoid-binding protein YceI
MIAGQIGYDKANPTSSTIGVIKLNARSFVTDDNGRNNMIRRAILKTEDDANEFITFKPTSIVEVNLKGGDALPGSVYDLNGDLTIAGITKLTTFRVETLMENSVLTIHAKTTVKRADFNLSIPNIPFIANVTDDVKLDLNLVATK